MELFQPIVKLVRDNKGNLSDIFAASQGFQKSSSTSVASHLADDELDSYKRRMSANGDHNVILESHILSRGYPEFSSMSPHSIIAFANVSLASGSGAPSVMMETRRGRSIPVELSLS